MNKKNIILLLLSLIIFSCLVYISYFAVKIHHLSVIAEEDNRLYTHHILVGVTDQDSAFTKDFYSGVQYMGSVFDGAVEMLEAPVAEDRVLEKWLDYAKFVDADGVILFTMDETFKPKPVLGLHDVEIPVVVAGECNNSENKVCQVTSDKKLLAKLAVQEIEKNGWEKPCALVRNSFPSDEIYRILSEMNTGYRIPVHKLYSDDVLDDEIRGLLVNLYKNRQADVLLCFTAEETNLAAQTIVEQNLGDRLSIISFYGNSKTKDYLEKGIVQSMIYIDAWEMGIACAEELFYWKRSGNPGKLRHITPKLAEGGER